MDIIDSTIPCVSSGVRAREEDFGLLLVSKRTPILSLNADSSIIWKLIDGKTSLLDISYKVNEEIGGNEQQTRAVIVEFMKSCHELGLIEL